MIGEGDLASFSSHIYRDFVNLTIIREGYLAGFLSHTYREVGIMMTL